MCEEHDGFHPELERLKTKFRSVAEMAEKGHVKTDTVKSWINRKSYPTFVQAITFARNLGISLDCLAGLPYEKHPNKTISQIIDLLEPLSEEALTSMLVVISECVKTKEQKPKERIRRVV